MTLPEMEAIATDLGTRVSALESSVATLAVPDNLAVPNVYNITDEGVKKEGGEGLTEKEVEDLIKEAVFIGDWLEPGIVKAGSHNNAIPISEDGYALKYRIEQYPTPIGKAGSGKLLRFRGGFEFLAKEGEGHEDEYEGEIIEDGGGESPRFLLVLGEDSIPTGDRTLHIKGFTSTGEKSTRVILPITLRTKEDRTGVLLEVQEPFPVGVFKNSVRLDDVVVPLV